MHFSCKISNAVLTLLESQNEDITPLYESVPTSLELLRDPSYWLSAHEMELFLEAVLRLQTAQETNLLRTAGHRGPQLRAWGVLDSVLRMMPRPQEVFNQPEQFLSYFISPKPPVDNFQRSESGISFDLPLPAEQYPLVTTYLKAAFEALPVYIGHEIAHCEWSNITLSLSWSNSQNSMFEQDPGHSVSPDLFKDLIRELQQSQQDRESLQKYVTDLEQKTRELESRLVAAQVSGAPSAEEKALRDGQLPHLSFDSESPYFTLGQNLARLHDYMVRAQQLVTVLTASTKNTPVAKEAMRRVDWDYVKEQYPRTVAHSMEVLRKIQSKNQERQEGNSHVRNP